MIELIQSPVIQQNLVELGKSVSDRIELLNIDNQIANTDTVKALKNIRATLNKEFAEFEDQRKFVKNGVLSPYNEFEDLYKKEVQDKYKNAIDTLKDKISFVENSIKDEKKKSIVAYFDELCETNSIDFVSFAATCISIDLSTSEKKYKEACDKFIDGVKSDLDLINTQDYRAEILVEYKNTLNVSKSIQKVKERIEAGKEEKERERVRLIANRKTALLSIGFLVHGENYVFNEEIFMSVDDVENLPSNNFKKQYIELQEKINAQKEQISAPKMVEPIPVTQESKEEIYTASFEVTGTMKELKSISEFLKSNNINYKNL